MKWLIDFTRLVWLEGVPFALRLLKQVFTNEDGSQRIVSLVCDEGQALPGGSQTAYEQLSILRAKCPAA